jgi:mxaJ protein
MRLRAAASCRTCAATCCTAITASRTRIDAVENGNIDVAVVWGPTAGYFAAQESTPLTIEPVQPWRDGTGMPMAFDISMGVRRGDNALLQRLNDSLERNRAAITAILAAYHVPVLPEAFATPG